MLKISNLFVSIEGKLVLKGINLEIKDGEILAIMGPNGNGKSTLLNTIMGHNSYNVEKGTITFNKKNLLNMDVSQRAKAGIFLQMQNPPEIQGVLNVDLIRNALNSLDKKPSSLLKFYNDIESNVKNLNLPKDYSTRNVNFGFSGGEKKKNELLHLLLLDPSFVMLDEIDSGLDVDSLKISSDIINNFYKRNRKTFVIISHYNRLFKLVKPTKVVVIIGGKIVDLGGPEIIDKIDKKGYAIYKKR